jgi:predicted nucleic acid-binding protein
MPGPWAYFDTSVLVKRYVEEEGAAQARARLRRHRFLSSAILPLEAIAALRRRRAAGELAGHDHAAIVVRLRQERREWELVELTADVLARAERLAEEHDLRALDAVHVASALEFEAAIGGRIPFVTADRRQRDAAEQLGLDVVWIGARAHP